MEKGVQGTEAKRGGAYCLKKRRQEIFVGIEARRGDSREVDTWGSLLKGKRTRQGVLIGGKKNQTINCRGQLESR